MFSIYHFFAHLLRNRQQFARVDKLHQFPFAPTMLSCDNKGQFPDLAIRLNPAGSALTGGELVELKDSSKSYSVSSFNSTIPTGQKDIRKVISGKNSRVLEQMEAAGDDVYSLLIRDVYYLVRGRRREHQKICLTHGSFFETVPVEQLIQQAFSQVLEDRMEESNLDLTDEIKNAIVEVFSEQKSFNQVRHVDNAAVSLRFRIMTEVKKEGNILNPHIYPDITNDTLNLIVPCPDDVTCEKHTHQMQQPLSEAEFTALNIFKIKHRLNGYFIVFQHQL